MAGGQSAKPLPLEEAGGKAAGLDKNLSVTGDARGTYSMSQQCRTNAASMLVGVYVDAVQQRSRSMIRSNRRITLTQGDNPDYLPLDSSSEKVVTVQIRFSVTIKGQRKTLDSVGDPPGAYRRFYHAIDRL